MKYEITKGSEKDFEGAPEWARLVVEHCEYKYNTWFYESDKAGGQWKQCKGQLRGIVERNGIGNWLNIIAERRPISEPVAGGSVIGKFVPIGDSSIHRKEFNVLTKEPSDYLAPAWKGKAEVGYDYHVTEKSWKFESNSWDGEGLPPVGVEVDIVDINECLRYGQNESGEVIAHVENTAVVRMSYGLGCFEAEFLRPIRSPEDVAREEAIEIMKNMYSIFGPSNVGMDNAIRHIYDAIAAGKIPGITLSGK